jgi:hypothetical protein
MAWPEPVGVVTWMGRDILRPRFGALLSRHHPPPSQTISPLTTLSWSAPEPLAQHRPSSCLCLH